MAMAFKQPIEPKKISTLAKHDKGYGTPVEGSKTEARAKLAHERISREILELCCVIADNGKRSKLRIFIQVMWTKLATMQIQEHPLMIFNKNNL